MPRRTSLEPNLSEVELGARYRDARDPVERSHWHFLWLLSNTVLVNRHFATIDELEDIQAERCVGLRSSPDIVRSATLFNYAMLLYYDSEWMLKELSALREKGVPEDVLRKRALAQQPDFRLRGTIRSVFDGRYRFTRYFSPLEFNRPLTLEDLFAKNDVELFDLASDPGEMRNLAMDRTRNGELLLAMNGKLNDTIAAEVGEDSPDVMPIRDGKVQVRIKSWGH